VIHSLKRNAVFKIVPNKSKTECLFLFLLGTPIVFDVSYCITAAKFLVLTEISARGRRSY